MIRPFLIAIISLASSQAVAATAYCADNARLEFLASDVIAETDQDGRREIWVDAGSLGTGVAGRLYATLSGAEMGVTFDQDDTKDVVAVRDGRTTVYRRCP